jgi:site-specific recombinase XerD
MYKRSGVWWTCIRNDGKKIQKSLQTTDRKLAKSIEAKIRTEIVKGKYYEKPIGSNKTFKDLMEKFMQEHAPMQSRNTQVSYNTSLNHLRPFFGETFLTAITPKMISRYQVLRRNEKAMPASINCERAVLSMAFTFAVKSLEWVEVNPVLKVEKLKENNQRERWLSEDEERRLLDNSPEWLRGLIILALNTGLRQSEQLSLEWQRVDLFRKTILIKETKNGKPKTLPLNRTALNILSQRSKLKSIKNDYVFFDAKGNKIIAIYLRRAFNRVTEKAGINNFRWHDLRHTFATKLAQRGVDLYKISKLLGHTDITMTQRYSHHCPDSLRDSVEILETEAMVDYNLTTLGEKRS